VAFYLYDEQLTQPPKDGGPGLNLAPEIRSARSYGVHNDDDADDIVQGILGALDGTYMTNLKILCHGVPGGLWLGQYKVDGKELGVNRTSVPDVDYFGSLLPFARLKGRFICGGLIQIYGCNVAADTDLLHKSCFDPKGNGPGFRFLKYLANLTGAAVEGALTGLAMYPPFFGYAPLAATVLAYPDILRAPSLRIDYRNGGDLIREMDKTDPFWRGGSVGCSSAY
jgi:hypothetical protein